MDEEDDFAWMEMLTPLPSSGIEESNKKQTCLREKKNLGPAEQYQVHKRTGAVVHRYSLPSSSRTYLLYLPPALVGGSPSCLPVVSTEEALEPGHLGDVSHQRVNSKRDPVPLLVYFHGKLQLAEAAMQKSMWVDKALKKGFAVAFLQAKGRVFENPRKHDVLDCTMYGDIWWDVNFPEEDERYVRHVVEEIKAKAKGRIDERRVYAVGHSNGGLFANNVAILMGDMFAAVVISMGGLQLVNATGRPHPKSTNITCKPLRKPPVYIITGTEDSMLECCEAARDAFTEAGYPVVKYESMEGRKHKYPVDKEGHMWSFLSQYSLSDCAASGTLCS